MRISDWSSDVCSSDLVALQAASRRPGLVRSRGLIEPSGFLKPEQLPAMRDTACLFVYGDNLGATPLWRSLMRQAADFRQGLEQTGAHVQWWEMAQRGIHGNSHLLMMDNNSDDVADAIGAWLLEQAPKVPAANSVTHNPQ